MQRNLSQKLSWRLFLWGLVLVPFFVVTDSLLDAVLFKTGSIREQLLFPSDHELSGRVLVCIFILAGIYLGMHFLANISKKERILQQRNKDLGLVRQDVETLHEGVSSQLRNSSSELETSLALFREQCHGIDEKVLFFVDKISHSSSKIQKQLQINQMLSELTFGEPYRERVKVDKLAAEVARELQEEFPEKQVAFKIHPWINCWCDRRMLRQIIRDLFCNALNFIPPSQSGQIEFGITNRNNQSVLFVRDNGTGFNEAQAERIFDPFRNPAQDPELPADTTLLANTRRIVHRHGGQIWAEGIHGAGGTFFFTYYTP